MSKCAECGGKLNTIVSYDFTTAGEVDVKVCGMNCYESRSDRVRAQLCMPFVYRPFDNKEPEPYNQSLHDPPDPLHKW